MASLLNSRYDLVGNTIDPRAQSLLDVGCRDGVLGRHVPPTLRYSGVDLIDGPEVDTVCNVEEGLPFPDDAFDVVTAIDLLEHTDRIWFVFDELVRVSRLQVIAVFPNLYHWRARLQYLTGREMDKYALSGRPVLDRHRWLTSYANARRFADEMAAKHRLSVREHVLLGGRKTFIVDSVLNIFSKNLGSWSVLFDFRASRS